MLGRVHAEHPVRPPPPSHRDRYRGGSPTPIQQRRETRMNDHTEVTQSAEPRPSYTSPQLIELDAVSKVTLGKYAEDSADQGRYFE